MPAKRQVPPFSALRAFEAAARHLSFRAAADEICVTPSAVSHIEVERTLLRPLPPGALRTGWSGWLAKAEAALVGR